MLCGSWSVWLGCRSRRRAPSHWRCRRRRRRSWVLFIPRRPCSGGRIRCLSCCPSGARSCSKISNRGAGPSGKRKIHKVRPGSRKRAKEGARRGGKGKPAKHPSPRRGERHFHSTDRDGEIIKYGVHWIYSVGAGGVGGALACKQSQACTDLMNKVTNNIDAKVAGAVDSIKQNTSASSEATSFGVYDDFIVGQRCSGRLGCD